MLVASRFLGRRVFSSVSANMAIASAQKRSSTGATKVLSANSTVLQFNSTLEDGGFSATGEDTHWIEESKRELRANNCIAIPTETVYGLAANALSSDAVKQIYKVKGRPSDNPLIVHVSSIRMLRALYHLPAAAGAAANGGLLLDPIMPFLGTNNAAMEGEELTLKLNEAESRDGAWPEIPKAYHEVIKRFWPGPLTIIMPRPQCIPIEVLGGHGDTVAFRFPSHPVARAIISACGLPLAAPSANASGRPSPTQAQHVKHDLDGRLPLIVDAGACDVGVESTVLDAFSKNAYVDGQLSPCILRPGGVTFEELRQLDHGMWRRLRVYRRDFTSKEIEVNPTTPGMKYRHYSPTAPVYLFVPSASPARTSSGDASAAVIQKMSEVIKQLGADSGKQKLGVVTIGGEGKNRLVGLDAKCAIVHHCVSDARDLAHQIFALLRLLDEEEAADAILVQGVSEDFEGLAVMNRLGKAASHHIVC